MVDAASTRLFAFVFAAVVVASHGAAHTMSAGFASVVPTGGYPECPCVSNMSTYGLELQAKAKDLQLPYGWGVSGCVPYSYGMRYPANCGDLGVDCKVNCQQESLPQYCGSYWCFVDPEVCPINLAACVAKGGQEGSTQHPTCRTRLHAASQTVPGAVYSFHTCGNLDFFTDDPFSREWDRVVRVATIKKAVWPVSHETTQEKDPMRPDLQLSGNLGSINGPLIEAFHDMVNIYFGSAEDNSPNVKIVLMNEGELATKGAQGQALTQLNATVQEVSGQYTACVIDVSVGQTDVCVGYIWQTQERERLTSFLPPIERDEMILLVPTNASRDESFFDRLGEYLEVPFEPFHAETWTHIFIFLAVAGVVIFLTELKEHSDDFPFPKRGYVMLRLGRALYFSVQGLFAGGIELKSPTIPSKVAKLGFTFFVFVVLASYISNLGAQILTRRLSTRIADVEDLIWMRWPVCVTNMDIIGAELLAKHPGLADLTVPADEETIWTFMKKDPIKCKAAILPSTMWTRAKNGEFAEKDCNRGSIYWCEVDGGDGLPDLTRDCRGFRKTGESLLHLPIAFPVISQLAEPLRKAWFAYVKSGEWEKKKLQYDHRRPKDVCEENDEEVDWHPGYPAEKMYGTVIITGIILVVAQLLWLLELYFGRHLSAVLGYPDPWLEEKQRQFRKMIKTLHGMETSEEQDNNAYDDAHAYDDDGPRHEPVSSMSMSSNDTLVRDVSEGPLASRMPRSLDDDQGMRGSDGPREASSSEIFGMIDDIDRSHRQPAST